MSMLFHDVKNVGRKVTINGVEEEICQVLGSKDKFRIKSEINGPTVNDYDESHIESAVTVTVSVNGGQTWINIPFAKE